MPRTITGYKILISCPGDVADEVGVIKDVIDDFNGRFTDSLGISLRAVHWSKDTYPQSGGKPQSLINNQIVYDCDAAIAVMWTRFGTPTDQYGSGTEEEIETMLSQGKQVFMYFSERPISPGNVDLAGYQKVCDFKKRYADLGIYWSYKTTDDFKNKLFAHLTRYFMEQLSKQTTSSVLPILDIIDVSEKKKEHPHVASLAMIDKNVFPIETLKSTILSEIQAASSIHLPQSNPLYSADSPYGKLAENLAFSPFKKPISISDDNKALLTTCAEKIGNIKLGTEFFYLGELGKQTALSSFPMRDYLDGTDQEKAKYNHIMTALKAIKELSLILQYADAFDGLHFIELALRNSGSTYDEDVSIELRVPVDSLVHHSDLPCVGDSAVDYLIDEGLFYDVFGITSNSEWVDYPDSSRPSATFHPPLMDTDPQEKYQDEMNILFAYHYYLKSDEYILQFDVPYIKQHTAVAFPSRLFFTSTPGEIQYKITSKHYPEIIEGSITVQ